MSHYQLKFKLMLFMFLGVLLWQSCKVPKKASAKNQQGKIAVDSITYNKMSSFLHGFARVMKDSAFFYINKDGGRAFKRILQEFHPIDSILHNENGSLTLHRNKEKIMRIVQSQDEKFGMVNEKGEWVFKSEYDTLVFKFKRYIEISKDGKMTYADSWGNLMLPLRFEKIGILDGSYFDVKENRKWGVFNAKTEEMTIPFEYDEIDYCSGCGNKSNYVYAKKEGKWGVVDFNNSTLIPFKYEHQHANMRSDEWVTAFKRHGENIIINIPLQKEYSEPEYVKSRIVNGYLITGKKINNQLYFGLIDRHGQEITAFEYWDISDTYKAFSTSSYLSVQKNKKHGIIDSLGNEIIPPKYSNGLQIAGDYFIAEENEKYGLIDINNEHVVDAEYDGIYLNKISFGEDPHEPVFKLEKAGKFGYYFPKISKLVLPEFDEIKFFNDKRAHEGVHLSGLMQVKKDGKFKLYDLNENKIIPGDYSSFKLQPNQKVILKKENQGLYDLKEKQMILPINFKSIKFFEDESKLIKVERNSGNAEVKVGIYDSSGEQILPVEFADITYLKYGNFLLRKKDSLFYLWDSETRKKEKLPFVNVIKNEKTSLLTVTENSESFLYDYKQKKIRQKEAYLNIQQLKNKCFLVTKRDSTNQLKYGFLNVEGELILPLKYDIREGFNLADFQSEKYLNLFKKDKISGKMLQGFANLQGEVLVPAKYQKVYPEESGNGFLITNGYHSGFINAEGKEVLPAKYNISLHHHVNRYKDTSEFSFPVLFAKDDIWRYLDKDGSVLPIKANGLIYFYEAKY